MHYAAASGGDANLLNFLLNRENEYPKLPPLSISQPGPYGNALQVACLRAEPEMVKRALELDPTTRPDCPDSHGWSAIREVKEFDYSPERRWILDTLNDGLKASGRASVDLNCHHGNPAEPGDWDQYVRADVLTVEKGGIVKYHGSMSTFILVCPSVLTSSIQPRMAYLGQCEPTTLSHRTSANILSRLP